MSRPAALPVALAAFLGVAFNIVAVVSLREISHTYAPGDVPAWLAETRAHPTTSTLSAWAFTVGLVALAAFFAGFAASLRSSWVTVGAAFFGAGALLDAAGTMAPIAALHVSDDVGLGLLWMSLLLDASFNFLLGVGLIALSFGLPDDWPKWHRWLALAAGVVSLPVAGQFASDDFARLLAIAGPLWLVWLTGAGVIVLRRPAA